MRITRREILKLGVAAGSGLTIAPDLLGQVSVSSAGQEILTKAIPSTGERVPVIGLGTASSFSGAAERKREPVSTRSR